jgi:hypothetical protein
MTTATASATTTTDSKRELEPSRSDIAVAAPPDVPTTNVALLGGRWTEW